MLTKEFAFIRRTQRTNSQWPVKHGVATDPVVVGRNPLT